MKQLKTVVTLLLLTALTFCLLTGCETEEDKIQKLSGTWYMTVSDSSDEATALLQSMSFYEEEIAFVDLDSLSYVQYVTLRPDKTYSFGYDIAGTKAQIRSFFTGAFDALYENRAELSALYDTDFKSMDPEQFRAYYADLYVENDFNALLNLFVEEAYAYDEMEAPWETGTYSIRDSRILCTVTGNTQQEYLDYSIENGTLTLTYLDGTEVYTRTP